LIITCVNLRTGDELKRNFGLVFGLEDAGNGNGTDAEITEQDGRDRRTAQGVSV